MKQLALLVCMIALTVVTSCIKKKVVGVYNNPNPVEFLTAVDITEQIYIDKLGVLFYDSFGKQIDVLNYFKQNGITTIRLRTWVGAGVKYSLKDVYEYSLKCKKAGFKIWLDFHYSNTWTDPGNQTIPQEWKNGSMATVLDSVFQYTRNACLLIHPDYVQIGNEINNGMMWPKGYASDTAGFYNLLRRGITGAKAYNPKVPVIIHFAGYQGSVNFFRELNQHNIHPEIAGLSYYPMWHGRNLDSLSNCMFQIHVENKCSCVIAETSYPFTLGWNDYTNNVIGDSSQLLKPYTATSTGQFNFLKNLYEVAYFSGPNTGICYWEPTWVAYKGKTSTDGSPWENQAWFDFNNRSLPANRAFKP